MRITLSSNIDIGEMLGTARQKDIDIKGKTLRDLLKELTADGSKNVNIVNARGDIDWDCEILVNGARYDFLPNGLDVELKEQDKVHIELLPLGGG